jgi:hypothetical protein
MGQFRIQNGYNLKIRFNGEIETTNATDIEELRNIIDPYKGENYEIIEAIHADINTGKFTDVKQTLTSFLN